MQKLVFCRISVFANFNTKCALLQPRNCVQPQTSTPFYPPSNDPYDPTLSDESIDLGLEIDSGSETKNNPENKNAAEIGTFTRTGKRALDAGEKAKDANIRPN